MKNLHISPKYPVFKVITRWPESYGRSTDGGDYKLGYWLLPHEKGYQKRYFTSYEGSCCPATGAYNCNYEPHDDGDFEYIDPVRVAEMLERYPNRIVPRYESTCQGFFCHGFYIEIDAVEQNKKEDVK